jgi:hypothetical protein
VAPIVVHGNGGGKRLFRILSCQVGVYCKWAEKASTWPAPAGNGSSTPSGAQQQQQQQPDL